MRRLRTETVDGTAERPSDANATAGTEAVLEGGDPDR
jgi:hypothetical protein